MTPVVAAKKLSKFDPKTFLSTMDGGRKIAEFLKKQTIFVQGDSSDAVPVTSFFACDKAADHTFRFLVDSFTPTA
jgi:hypothetical protein